MHTCIRSVDLLTPDEVAEGAEEEVGAALLHAAAVGVEVDVSQLVPGAEAAAQQRVAVRVDDVHKLGVTGVQAGRRRVALEQRTSRVQT